MTDSRSQPSIVERLRIWHKPDETITGDVQLCLDAADRIEELEAALQFIADGYDNHNVNHVDYRVKVYQVALDALDLARTEQERGG